MHRNKNIMQRKIKVKLSLCLTKHDGMQGYWGVEVYLHAFLTSALDERIKKYEEHYEHISCINTHAHSS
jgi:hypothetical protein